MLNAADIPSEALPSVVDYADAAVADKMANGRMNTAEAQLLANVQSAIRRGHPQMRGGPVQAQRVCLVGSGPSLADTEEELRALLWDGAVLVTLNGAYHWCRERNLRPQTQIVMDARASNARFVQPYTPKCNYVLASQCDPAVWDAVQDYPDVWIWHPVVKSEGVVSQALDAYYGGNWIGIGGGTSVATRAINLLRTAGYLHFSLFGIDCCWSGDQHHALAQPENAHDARSRSVIRASVRGSTESREFTVSPWMLKQAEDFCVSLKVNGKHYTLDVHGDGLLAYLVRTLGTADPEDVSFTPAVEAATSGRTSQHGSTGMAAL